MSDPNPTHGGVIVFRDSGTGPQVLVITAKERPEEWVLVPSKNSVRQETM